MLVGARQECVHGDGDLSATMAALKDLDYDFLEVSLTREEIAQLDEGSAKEYVAATERIGLPILSTSLGHFGGLAALSAPDRDAVIEDVRRYLRFSQSIGADVILLATTEESWDIGAYADVYRAALGPVADEAAAVGVTLALEHVGRYPPFMVAKLVRAIGHRAVRMYFDIGNCLYVGESPIEQARICAPLTAQFHVKGGPVAPFASMPLQPVRKIMEAAGFQGRCCLEIAAGAGDLPLREARGLLKMAGYF